MRLGRPLVVFPVLVAIYAILNLYAVNVDRLRFADMLGALAAATATSLVVLMVLRLLLKSWAKAGLLALVVVFLFFSYGHVRSALGDTTIGEVSLQDDAVLLPTWGLIFAAAVYATLRWGGAASQTVRILNLIAAVLVALPVLNVGLYVVRNDAWPDFAVSERRQRAQAAAASDEGESLPDIYYIILDGYARGDILIDHYGYDNSEFLDSLEDMGFYVADQSVSPTSHTMSSLSSSLNMRYTVEEGEPDSKDESEYYQLIQQSEVARILRSKGYTLVNVSSGWGPTNRNPYFDVNYRYNALSQFDQILIETTLLAPFADESLSDDRRLRVRYTFDKLGDIPDEVAGPKFVLVHVTSPHDPYVFDRDGNPVSPKDIRSDHWVKKAAYVNQLIFISSEAERAASEILARSDRPPIIILQGDHGWEVTGTWKEGKNYELIRSRLSPLNAYYLPDEGKNLLYPSISPINSFRLILDHYLGTSMGLLEDKAFYENADRDYVEFKPPSKYKCEDFGYGYNYARETVLDWGEETGQPVYLVVRPNFSSDSYWGAADVDGFARWSGDDVLRVQIAQWVKDGGAIFFVDEVPSNPLPDRPFGAMLETASEYPLPCSDDSMRVRRLVEAGPDLRHSIFEVVFPNPNDSEEQYRAIVTHLIETGADGAVVVYPPNQQELLASRLEWGTEIDEVVAVGDSWPLDTNAAAEALERLAEDHQDLHVVLLDAAAGDPRGFIRGWLDEHLTLVSQQQFGPIELLHYTHLEPES